jgi:hypothetical protein
MDHIESRRTTPPPARRGAAASAATIVLTFGLVIALVAAACSGARAEEPSDLTSETFTANSTIDAPSATPTEAGSAVPSAAAPSVSATQAASPSPVVDPDHVATRVWVPDLRIDLAVVAPPKDLGAYPKCNVAMYLAALNQPGDDGATYLYAHARAGMFLPIYERAIQKRHGGPRSMLGMRVEVFTSDNLRYVYKIKEVRIHQTRLTDAARARSDELWLQTSEGPKGTKGKTQVRAVPVGVQTATQRQAHPVGKPVTCG